MCAFNHSNSCYNFFGRYVCLLGEGGVDNATTGVETCGIRHGFGLMTWAPYQEAVACDTLPQRGAAAIIRKPPRSARSRPTARTVTRERRAWRRGASDEGAAAALAGAMRLVRRPVEYARYAGMEGPAALPAGGASTGKGDCVRRSPTPPVHTSPAGGASVGCVCVQAGKAIVCVLCAG